MMRSSGWLGWDPHTERPVFTQHPEEVTERWANQAAALAAALDGCHVRADPPSDNDEPRLRIWSAPIRLARELGLSLVADDAALRAVARSEGVAAFGSLQLLEALAQAGMLPADAPEQSHGRKWLPQPWLTPGPSAPRRSFQLNDEGPSQGSRGHRSLRLKRKTARHHLVQDMPFCPISSF